MPNYLGKEKHKFEVLSDGDEVWEIWLDGSKMISVNHDQHGWEGIEGALELTNSIAEKLGIEVVEGEINE